VIQLPSLLTIFNDHGKNIFYGLRKWWMRRDMSAHETFESQLQKKKFQFSTWNFSQLFVPFDSRPPQQQNKHNNSVHSLLFKAP
jgi:hypothetical protein